MKSVTKFASSGLGGKRKDESAQAAGQLIMKAAEEDEKKHDVTNRQRKPEEWGLLSWEEEKKIKATSRNDDFYLDLAGGSEFRELLAENAKKVQTHCKSLSSSQSLPEVKLIGTDPAADGICLVTRFEAEDIIAGGAAENRRVERAAESWVKDHVNFKSLEELSDTLEKHEQYKGLRGEFARHHRYHPCLQLLTDHSLIEEGLWSAALQEAKYPTQPPETPTAAPQRKGFLPGSLSKSKIPQGKTSGKVTRLTWSDKSSGSDRSGGPGSGRAMPQAGRLRSNRSAPALR
jgi:hypothetical protein